jgi:hypothetical protein
VRPFVGQRDTHAHDSSLRTRRTTAIRSPL